MTVALLTLASLARLAIGIAAEEPGQAPKPLPAIRLPPPVEEALWWLPEDTQTVVVDQEASRFHKPGGDGEGERSADPWFLSNIRGGALARRLAGLKVRLQVEGSRRFRACRALGMMPYEGATLIFLERGLEEGIAGALHEGAAKAETISSRRVSLFRNEFEKIEWTIYVTQPRADLLVFATDRGYLAGLLGRMDRRGESRALPEGIPEWRLLDPASPRWAIRHYDPSDAALDPTSPLGDRDGWYVRDPEAVGLVFQVDPKRRRGSLRQVSRSADALDRVEKFWRGPNVDPQMGTKPDLRLIEPGVVEVSTPLGGEDKAAMFFFILSAALGHAICL